MTPEPVGHLPIIVFSLISLILPVVIGISAKSWRAFRISLIVGLLVIFAMLCGPYLQPISEAEQAYLVAAILIIFPFSIGMILTDTGSNDMPLGIYFLYSTPVAFTLWLVLAQLLAISPELRAPIGDSQASHLTEADTP